MPAFTFTADSTTDQLAITGHGLLTGDGPIAVRNVGGALPTGLAAVTSYFAIRVDADHLKLATSSANALAGTAINLTSNGSGTNILEIGLPFRVPRIAVPGIQVFSADSNATWQSLVALHGLLTGQAQAIWDGVTLAVPLTMAADQDVILSGTGDVRHGDKPISLHASAFHAAGNNSVSSPSNVSSGGIPGVAWRAWGAAPNNAVVAGLHFRAGDRIKTVTWFYNKAGNSSPMGFKLAINTSGSPSEGGVSDNDVTSSSGVVSKTTTIDHEVADNEAISLRVDATVAAQEFYGCKIIYDRP